MQSSATESSEPAADKPPRHGESSDSAAEQPPHHAHRSDGPWDAAGLLPWARAARERLRARRLTAVDAVVVGALVYIAVITGMRFFWSFLPWAADGDWKQWIWEYHRYYTAGAFPPGHVITDYQFRVQPPLYYVVMAALSHVVHPGVAARMLSWLAYGGALTGVYRATTRLSHWAVGLACAVALAHNFSFFHQTMGGYPRSFGPTFVLLFIDAWLARRHRLVLVWLVAMGGMYPSTLPPCGLAYGIFVVVEPWLPAPVGARALRPGLGWLGRVASVAGAGVAASALALVQNLRALPWWGPVITLAQAQSLPALQAGGRMRWLPLGTYWGHIAKWALQPFDPSGALAYFDLLPWGARVSEAAGAALLGALAAVVLVNRRRFPWELLLLGVAAALSYWAARVFAFRMYLPHRVIQHVLPYCTLVALGALAFQACRALLPKRAVAAAVAVVLVPMFTLGADGVLVPSWNRDDDPRPLMRFLREHTPVTAQFAGDLDDVDKIPYFAARQVYVNWTMAHPFRLGYWHEMERRLLRMHDAMFSADRARVLAFVDEEKIDYFVLDTRQFDALDDSGLFFPIRSFVTAIWDARKPEGFVLAAPPDAAVVYRDGPTVVVDAHALAAAWR